MQIQLTYVTTRRSGAQARRVETREDDVLTIGRGTDNDVSLPGLAVSLHHASFRRAGAEIHVDGHGANVVTLNGRIAANHVVVPGDVVRIGSFELRILPLVAGVDLALEIEEVERAGDAREALARRTRLGIAQGWLSKRRLSLLGILVLALLYGWLPWRAVRWSEPAQGLPERPLERASVAAVQTWSPGAISGPHRQFAQECGRCHVTGFDAVRDADCLTCHAQIEAHAAPEVSPRELSEARCTSCHTEHRGVHGLMDQGTSGCAPCHGTLAALATRNEHAVASDFGTDHPEFRLTVIENATTGARRRVSWRPDLQESTGLIYSHVRHVGQAVENRATGESEYMRCDSCHIPEASGKNYEDVRFDTRCQSCHPLGFDVDFPEKQAFHGDPATMRTQLLEFYSAVALGGLVPPKRAPGILRAAPGRALSPDERRAALAWARAEASAASAFLMEGKERCGMCHPIEKGAAADGGDGVAPVDVPRWWLPAAQFSHRSHMPSPCSTCHAEITVFDPEASPEVPRPAWAARGSEPFGLLLPEELARMHPGRTPSDAASDVSIPGRDDCRTCHLGPEAHTGFVASECALCHDFHRAGAWPSHASQALR